MVFTKQPNHVSDLTPDHYQTELRRQVENRLNRMSSPPIPSLTEENMMALVHELQVHQIELELQNDELKRAHAELEAGRAELRELTRKLFTAQEDERKRIAREIHDDHCQRVTALILEANILRKGCEREAPDLAPRLAGMSQKLSGILNDFRTLSHELLARHLGDTSLVGQMRNLINEFSDKSGFHIELFAQALPADIPSGTMTTLFRLLQESLSNIVKHANAKHVAVTLGRTEQGVELVVTDDGIGFDTTRAWDGQQGMGIVGMRERLRLVGGTVTITSEPDHGTTIIFSVPYEGH